MIEQRLPSHNESNWAKEEISSSFLPRPDYLQLRAHEMHMFQLGEGDKKKYRSSVEEVGAGCDCDNAISVRWNCRLLPVFSQFRK